MDNLYSVKQASELTGISRPALRQYTEKYKKYLSTEATPEKGSARQFTAQDLKLLRFVYQLTATGMNHIQVEYQLESGELERYAWNVDDADTGDDETTALMAPDMVRVTQAWLEEARRREETMALRERELQEKINQLERELGEARGRLDEVKSLRYRAPKWWRSVFGGRPE